MIKLVIGYILGLMTMLFRDAYTYFKKTRLPNRHDKEVFARYRELFNEKVIYCLKAQNFSAPFEGDVLKGMYDFVHKDLGDEADYKFHSRKLEKVRKRVMLLTSQFVEKAARSLHDIHSDGYVKIPKPEIWDETLFETYEQKNRELNQLASELYRSIDRLIMVCNKQFDKKINSSE